MGRYFIPVIYIFSLFHFTVTAQSFDELITLYKDQKHEQLKKEIDKLPDDPELSKTENAFLKALTTPNAEEAKRIYERLFDAGSPKVRYLAAQKLMQYHYARGYYITSEDYQKYLLRNEKDLQPGDDRKLLSETYQVENAPGPSFFIQVGAFGYQDNAEQLQSMLETQNIKCSIVPRNIGGTKLFCVWIKGKTSLDETISFANDIKERYDLNYRIIKE